ncbi:hypothetical protein Zmor_006698 [Zophobas morio]|uniref:Uncharacterized protein n=1 Tax=Zophobas morio TaxID=2755281 RepID=A0AA38IWF6_9CUCU|nr:hypothetical protein Zmor_006698 [Zophobas morio]
MYRIIATRMDLTRLYFSHCLDFTDCYRRWFPFKLPRCSSRKVAVSASRLLLEHPLPLPLPGFSLANAVRPPSPTMSHPSSLHILENPWASYRGGVWVYFVTV